MSCNPESGPLSLTVDFIARPYNSCMNSNSPALGPSFPASGDVVISGWLDPCRGGRLTHWRWTFTLAEGNGLKPRGLWGKKIPIPGP